MSKYKRDDKGISSLRFFIYIFIALAVLTFVDRFTKHLAVAFLKGNDGISLIDGTLKLYYLENRGAAWGMFEGQQWFFFLLTAVFIVLAVWFFIKVPKNKYYRMLNIAVTILLAGAIGNFIDRIINKYVVDFIYFELIDFPVFNVADIYVTISVIMLLILSLFRYGEGDFFFLSRNAKTKDRKEQADE
jgi:signal peptidase II